MVKQLKLMRDYYTSPLWKTGGAEVWGSLDDSLGDVNLDELPISDALKSRLLQWQSLADNYARIMDAVPGGGWSRYTDEEFEAARQSLGLPLFDSKAEELEGLAIWQELCKELQNQDYEVYYFSPKLAPDDPEHLLRNPSEIPTTASS
jgi:hypothetical protein